jgi:N,N'-diacetylchitobiose transport system permease protein
MDVEVLATEGQVMSATGIEATRTRDVQPSGPGDADTRLVRGKRRRDRTDKLIPYWLSLPTLLIVVAIFGYPFVKMIIMSFQEKSAHNLFRDVGPTWAGLKNFKEVFSDGRFWTITVRTVVFTVLVVVASVVLAMLVALMLNHSSRWAKILLTTVLMFVWSVPQIVSIQLFGWLTDPDFSVINWLLSKLGFNMIHHDWFRDPHQGLAVAGVVVVWGAIPFLAITLHAGMSMVPKELNEAAEIDGANAWRRFRAVTLPILRPLLVIITTLSVIWDIQVFNQIYLLRHQSPEETYWTLAVYTRNVALGGGGNYFLGSAIGVITVLLMLVVMIFYIRQIFRIGDYE